MTQELVNRSLNPNLFVRNSSSVVSGFNDFSYRRNSDHLLGSKISNRITLGVPSHSQFMNGNLAPIEIEA